MKNQWMMPKIEPCGICEQRAATVFMVVRQDHRVAKEHVCLTCFELLCAEVEDVESVSLQDYRETVCTTGPKRKEAHV